MDNARRKRAKKHGGEFKRVEVPEIISPPEQDEDRILAVNEALEKLAARDQPKAELVKLRYFVGLTTADRHWAYARAWLAREIREAE